MSFLVKNLQLKQILRAHNVLSAIQTRNDHWAPHYIPGPYPKTKEEREAAAKKYNLLPEEYEPYPDDGMGFGDYPKLPYESVPTKDPYYPWDDQELRRNYMDPVHYRIANLLPEQDPVDIPFKQVLKELVLCNLIPIAIVAAVLYYLNTIHFHHGNEKQYPQPGVVHYTFELDVIITTFPGLVAMAANPIGPHHIFHQSTYGAMSPEGLGNIP